MRTKISVIIPTYNTEKHIESCIQSIIRQTYSNFEILVMDGLSIDNTSTIVEKLSKEDKRIVLHSQKDSGIYDAMNKGIDLASGEWIYFLGADDTLYNENVFKQFIEIDDLDQYDAIYGDVVWGDTGKLYDGDFGKYKIIFQNICHQAIFFKNNVFKKNGKYSLSYPILADYAFNIEIILSDNFNIKYFPVIIANYSLSGLSSGKYDSEFFIDRISILNKYVSNDFILCLDLYNKKLYDIEYYKRELNFRNQEFKALKRSWSFLLGYFIIHPWKLPIIIWKKLFG